MESAIAWLSQGKIRLKPPGQPPVNLDSIFINEMRDRALKAQQRHGWKGQGNGERMLPSSVLWGKGARDVSAIAVEITSLARGKELGEVFYSLQTDVMSAVLAIQNSGESEKRVWNKNNQFLGQLSVSHSGAIAASVRHPGGTANIVVRPDEESGFGDVTEGDSFDTSPSWVNGSSDRLVFSSAGVGRNSAGQFAGLGPFSLQLLDLNAGEMSCLLEAPHYDLITPRMTPDGTLYFIQRPYEGYGKSNFLGFARDFCLFPFRLGLAVLAYLQFFSMRYRGKKLSHVGDDTAGKQADLEQMIILGNVVRAQSSKSRQEDPDLVSRDWKLVRRTPQGAETVLASAVLAFDVNSRGEVVYTNGSAVFLLSPKGEKTRVATDSMIQNVVLLDPPSCTDH